MSQRLQSPTGIARPDHAVTSAAWDCFVSGHPNAHFLQTSAWAALKERFGWQARCVAIPAAEGGAIQAGAMVLLRRAAGLTVAYVPRGPVVDWSRPTLVADTLAAVEEESRRAGASVLRLEPELADTPQHRALLRKHGYIPSPQTVQPPSTIVLPLDGDEEAILGRMKSKWRYNIRLAERKGVVVRPMRRDELPAFNELMAETGRRDRFALHTPDYYTAAYDLLTPETGVFLLAGYKDQPLAAIVVLVCGPMAWYVWGASSSRERHRMPNHALQWAGMRWAKERGAVRYDLWGIPDAIGQVALGLNHGDGSGVPVESIPVDLDSLPGEDLWGVYRFKQGFGGQAVRHVGTWDKPLHPVGYRLFQVGLALQRTERRLMQSWGEPSTGGLAVTEVHTPAEWRAALAALPDAHVLQSWEWGAVKAQTDWRAERVVLREPSGQAKAAYQFLTRRLASGLPLGIGYVPKGPVLDWTNSRLVETVLAQIERHARRQGCIFVKIDPDVEENLPEGIRLRQLFRLRGWRFSADQIQFKNSAITDLRGDEATLLEGMKSKWRYNIRLAERRGIHVRRGGEADLPTFYALYQETARRDGFLIRPFDYYRTTWTTFLRAGAESDNPAGGALLLAEHEEEPIPLAGLFLLRYGPRAWYFYGASSDRRRRDMPNYLLQWEALRWARANGCTVYDWWGAPTRLDDPNDGLQGVWQFKQGFGARFVERTGAWDYPVYPGLYRLYTEAMPRLLAYLRRQAPASTPESNLEE